MNLKAILLSTLILFCCTACAPLGDYRNTPKDDPPKKAVITAVTPAPGYNQPSPAPKEPRIEITPGTTETTTNKFEDISKQLYTANMAYTVPDKVNIKDSFKVQLLIDPTKGITELLNALTVAGNKTTRSIKVSRVVNAKITAPDFNVVEVTPSEQAISNSSTTEWLWTLTPKSAGKHEINITVTALITVDDKLSTHHLKTFESDIIIDVTTHQLITGWFNNYWQWLLTTFIIPLVIWICKKKFSKAEN